MLVIIKPCLDYLRKEDATAAFFSLKPRQLSVVCCDFTLKNGALINQSACILFDLPNIVVVQRSISRKV